MTSNLHYSSFKISELARTLLTKYNPSAQLYKDFSTVFAYVVHETSRNNPQKSNQNLDHLLHPSEVTSLKQVHFPVGMSKSMFIPGFTGGDISITHPNNDRYKLNLFSGLTTIIAEGKNISIISTTDGKQDVDYSGDFTYKGRFGIKHKITIATDYEQTFRREDMHRLAESIRKYIPTLAKQNVKRKMRAARSPLYPLMRILGLPRDLPYR